jgi:bifunctional non-homologous end joining protein LigD
VTVVDVRGRPVRLTSLERVLFPAAHFTKRDLVAYEVAIAPALLPHLRGRPLSLRRFPEGVTGQTWFQTQCRGAPPWVRTISLTVPGGDPQEYCVIDDLAGLLWTANLSAIELHPLLMRADDAETPTSVVLDLDPGPPAGLPEACRVAVALREALLHLGLRSLVKSSGVKGLHVVIPLDGTATFETTKRFAREMARAMAEAAPDAVVDRQRTEDRRGRVLVDWLQNDRRRSIVAPYSLRAGVWPQVSMPLAWQEVADVAGGADPDRLRFGPRRAIERMERDGDRFAPVTTLRQRLPGAGPAGGRCPICGASFGDERAALEHAWARHGLAGDSESAGGTVGLDTGGEQAGSGAGRVQTE